MENNNNGAGTPPETPPEKTPEDYKVEVERLEKELFEKEEAKRKAEEAARRLDIENKRLRQGQPSPEDELSNKIKSVLDEELVKRLAEEKARADKLQIERDEAMRAAQAKGEASRGGGDGGASSRKEPSNLTENEKKLKAAFPEWNPKK